MKSNQSQSSVRAYPDIAQFPFQCPCSLLFACFVGGWGGGGVSLEKGKNVKIVVSQNEWTPIKTSKYYSTYYGDPKKLLLILGNHPILP